MRLAVGFVSLCGVATGCQEPPAPKAVRPLLSMKVGDEAGLEGRWWPGRAKATLEVDIGFEVSGQLVERPVNVGDEVSAGTVMARIDPRDYENALTRAKAERDRAKAFLDRVEIAARTGAVSRQEVDDARARFNQADAQVAIRQKAVEDTRIVAPFDGIVSATYLDNFQNVRPKQPVIRFLDVSRIEMIINVPENMINLAPYVRDVRVRFDALPGQEVSARIKEVGSEASEATRTYPITLIMDPAAEGVGVKPGMAGEASATVDVPEHAARAGIEVPQSALFTPDGEESGATYVWVVDEAEQTVHRRQVVPGSLTLRGGTLVQGLEGGERIAVAGVHRLEEGQKVQPIDRQFVR
jgi:RND family efflux transporter MFP subunit